MTNPIFCFLQIFISMTKKVIISERQLRVIADYISEANQQEALIKKIKADLDLNYEPSNGTYKKGGEYFEEPMIMNKVNQELMTPKSLFDYMKYKYELGDNFIKQIIDDWYKGNLNDSDRLSKNVSMV